MSSFSLHISTDNAAFHDEDDDGAARAVELARLLHSAAQHLESGEADQEGIVRDGNGNTVGRYFWTDRDQTHDDGAALDLVAARLRDPDLWTDDLEHIAEAVETTGREARS